MIYKYIQYINACVCIYIYIINIHSTHTYVMYTKTFILDVINHLIALNDTDMIILVL